MRDETHRFDGLADTYARWRPGYPPELVARLRALRGLPEGAHVADVGCGTGLLAQAFLAGGCRVTGVEPSEPMRAHAVARLADQPRFTARAGTAEDTGLPDASVHAVVAGQAFHWFDPQRAAREFGRVLRPGGWVALVWNDRHDLSQPFLAEYEGLLRAHCPGYGGDLRDAAGEQRVTDFFGAGRVDAGAHATLELRNPQRLTLEALLGRTASASYVPREGAGRAALFAGVRAAFARHARAGLVAYDLRTIAYHGTLPALTPGPALGARPRVPRSGGSGP